MIPYDLLDVAWGEEQLRARPISWDKDLTADDMNPEETEDVHVTAYELTCPGCGSRCEFRVIDNMISCGECESETINPIYVAENPTEMDQESEPDLEPELDLGGLEEDIEKIKEDLEKSEEPASPEDVLDNLTASITNTEVILEEPDEKDKVEIEKSKKSSKKKTKKKTKKKKKK